MDSGWLSADDGGRLESFYSILLVLKAEWCLYLNASDSTIAALDKADKRHGADATSLVIRAQSYMMQKKFEDAGNCYYQAEEWYFNHDDSMLSQVWSGKLDLAHECNVAAPPYAELVYKEKSYRKPVGDDDDLFERDNRVRDEGLLFDALCFYDAALEDAFSLYSDALKEKSLEDDEFKIRVHRANVRAMKNL